MTNHAHPYQAKRYFWLPAWFSVADGTEVDAHDWHQENCKGNILKSGREIFVEHVTVSHCFNW